MDTITNNGIPPQDMPIPSTPGYQQPTLAESLYDIGEKLVSNATEVIADATDRSITDSSLGQSKYSFTNRVFPSDLETESVGHYVVFNINVPTARGSGSGVRGNLSNRFGSVIDNEFSKVDTLRFGQYRAFAGIEDSVQRSTLTLKRGTRRITESIAMHMPTPVVFNQQSLYPDVSLTDLASGILGQAASFFAAFGRGGAALAAGAGGAITNAAGQQTGTLGQVAQLAGSPIIPSVEVLFGTTIHRQFMFEFMLAPRNKKESDAAFEIIKAFRFWSMPEIETGGFTFIPPAEFDITFYNKGVENLAIPRINTCVLERVEVDYAPSGVYSTFSTGHPVAMRLSLGFKEVELLHKRRIAEGF